MSMNNANATATGETHNVSKTNINPTKLITIMWPAVMFANKRIIKANGLVKIPTISIGIKIGYNAFGAGGKKMCPQYALFALTFVTIKVMIDSTNVKAILPVTFALIGISPNTLLIKIIYLKLLLNFY